MNKLTYLIALLALFAPVLEGYKFHPSAPSVKEQEQEDEEYNRFHTGLIGPDQEESLPAEPAEDEEDNTSFFGRFLRGRNLQWGWSSGGSCRGFFTSCSNRDDYTTGNTVGGGNHPVRPDTIRPGNVVQVLQKGGDYTILLALLETAGLVDALSSPTAEYTVFAPRNSAFIGMDAVAIQSDVPLLQQILTYHVVGEEVMALEMETGQSLTTLQGGNITLTVDQSIPSVFINTDQARVVMVDMQASNGVIHTIDAVLTPP